MPPLAPRHVTPLSATRSVPCDDATTRRRDDDATSARPAQPEHSAGGRTVPVSRLATFVTYATFTQRYRRQARLSCDKFLPEPPADPSATRRAQPVTPHCSSPGEPSSRGAAEARPASRSTPNLKGLRPGIVASARHVDAPGKIFLKNFPLEMACDLGGYTVITEGPDGPARLGRTCCDLDYAP
jgi:hypothetical protein